MSARVQNRRRHPLFRSKATRVKMMIGLKLVLMEYVDLGGGDLERKAVALATIRTTLQCIMLFSLLPLIYSYVSFTVGFVGELIGFCSFGNFEYTGWRDAIDGRWITFHELRFIQESVIRDEWLSETQDASCNFKQVIALKGWPFHVPPFNNKSDIYQLKIHWKPVEYQNKFIKRARLSLNLLWKCFTVRLDLGGGCWYSRWHDVYNINVWFSFNAYVCNVQSVFSFT